MSNAIETEPLRYRGYSSSYVDIASRGGNEFLGLGLQYAKHPDGTGCLIVRFVAHGEGVKKDGFTHLLVREPGRYQTFGPHAKGFTGFRLAKIGFPVLSPAVYPHELEKFLTKFGVFPMLEEWIAEQATSEGFTVTVDLAKEIHDALTVPSTPEDSVTCVVAFPDIAAANEAVKKPVLTLVQPEEEDGDDEEEADEDDKDDDDSGGKDWMN